VRKNEVAGGTWIVKRFPQKKQNGVLRTVKLIHTGGINNVNRGIAEMIGTKNQSRTNLKNSTVNYPLQQTSIIREKNCLFTIAQHQDYL
jgi:hypothetical protein